MKHISSPLIFYFTEKIHKYIDQCSATIIIDKMPIIVKSICEQTLQWSTIAPILYNIGAKGAKLCNRITHSMIFAIYILFSEAIYTFSYIIWCHPWYISDIYTTLIRTYTYMCTYGYGYHQPLSTVDWNRSSSLDHIHSLCHLACDDAHCGWYLIATFSKPRPVGGRLLLMIFWQ